MRKLTGLIYGAVLGAILVGCAAQRAVEEEKAHAQPPVIEDTTNEEATLPQAKKDAKAKKIVAPSQWGDTQTENTSSPSQLSAVTDGAAKSSLSSDTKTEEDAMSFEPGDKNTQAEATSSADTKIDETSIAS